ncbi:hypothetical protein ACFXCZ_00995 [Streptomyces sp. NPDC059396]|uniref:hypothetical protein n=1 Tax=Streptomyces sp. NPDC059396 TaxID=3346819 RepID=UPI00367B0593
MADRKSPTGSSGHLREFLGDDESEAGGDDGDGEEDVGDAGGEVGEGDSGAETETDGDADCVGDSLTAGADGVGDSVADAVAPVSNAAGISAAAIARAGRDLID